MEKQFPTRKTPRLQGFDYSQNGAYFITICTKNRRCILSRIVGTGVPDCPHPTAETVPPVGTGVLDCPKPSPEAVPPVGTGVLASDRAQNGSGVINAIHSRSAASLPRLPKIELTKYGEIADKYIKQISDHYDHLSVESYVIMPNHIHLLLLVKSRNIGENGQSGTPVPTNVARANSVFSAFVSTFKRFCNKEYGENIWQARAYDHVIRGREDYEEHLLYIHENPMRWQFDTLYPVGTGVPDCPQPNAETVLPVGTGVLDCP